MLGEPSLLGYVFGVGLARWPDGPPQSRVAHGFSLIPVSGVLGPVDEDKTGGKAENSGTPRSHMVRGWDDFRDTQNRPNILSHCMCIG